ncbi:MAG: PAS domain S-box protein, partial [Flavobacterium sp.]|nr:PAS domain S-box protein [Flavobacterium sp.]
MIDQEALLEFFRISPTPCLVLLPNAPFYTIVEVNYSYLDITNSNREDLIGKGISEIFQNVTIGELEGGIKGFINSLDLVSSTQKSHKMPMQRHKIKIADSEAFQIKYWNSENIPLLNNKGELQMIIHKTIDITNKISPEQELSYQLIEKNQIDVALKNVSEALINEQSKSQELNEAYKALAESNERFEYVTKATFDAIWDWDLTKDTLYWGEGIEKIFGHKISDLDPTRLSWTNNIHPDDLPRLTSSYYNIIKSSTNNWIEEYRFKKADGTYCYVNNKGIVIRDKDNRATRVIGAMHDISKKREEEQRLKLLESVITNATDAVLVTEATQLDYPGPKIVFVNDAFTAMTGYTSEEVIGKTPRILQGLKTDKDELKKLSYAIRHCETYEGTLINYKKNGEEFWITLSITPVVEDMGKCTHFIAIERDVTEKILKEQKLANVSRKLLNTLESIQDGFYTLDNNWNVSYWNQEAERISGKSVNEMMGKNFWDVYEGSISKMIYSKFLNAKKENTPIHLEFYSKVLSNWYEINAFPSDEGLTVYFKDISERKLNESEMKKLNISLELNIKKLAISNEELEQFAYVASHDLQEPLRMITGFLTQLEKKYDKILDEKGKQYIYFAVDGARRMRQIILDILELSRVGKNKNKLEKLN